MNILNNHFYLQHIDADHINPVNLKRVKFIIDHTQNHAKQKCTETLDILDLGCGKGNIAFPLASFGHNITGIDLDPNSIAICNSKNTFPNATFQVGNAESLAKSSEFDIVVCPEVLEHTDSPNLVLQSIDKVLKTDGILILTVPNGYCMFELIFCRLLCLGGRSSLAFRMMRPIYGFITGVPTTSSFPFCTDSLHKQFFSFRGLYKLLTNHGFKILAITHSDLGLLIPSSGRLRSLKNFECRLADGAPHFLAGGWFLLIEKV